MAITTSPYINGPDILEHPTRTVKEVHLDFSGVADGCIKAGSPISAAGKVANDATAIGILLHDNYSDCGCGHGMVVVAGRIKADVAEQHSGIAISPEAKGGMPCVAFVDAAGIVTGGGSVPGGSAPSGPVSWNDLTDKPFYDESRILYEGQPEYKFFSATVPFVLRDGIQYDVGYMYPVSGAGLRVGTYVASATEYGTIDLNYEGEINAEGDWGVVLNISTNVDTNETVICPQGGVFMDGKPQEPGDDWAYAYTSTVIIQISYHNAEDAGSVPLPERFMPLLTSPNGTKYKLAVADDGTLSAVAE